MKQGAAEEVPLGSGSAVLSGLVFGSGIFGVLLFFVERALLGAPFVALKKLSYETGLPISAPFEIGISLVNLLDDYWYVLALGTGAAALLVFVLGRSAASAKLVWGIGLASLVVVLAIDLLLAVPAVGMRSQAAWIDAHERFPGGAAWTPGAAAEVAAKAIDAFREALSERRGVLHMPGGDRVFVLFDGPGVTDHPASRRGAPDYESCWKQDSCILFPWGAGAGAQEPYVFFPRPKDADLSPATLASSGVKDQYVRVPGADGMQVMRMEDVFSSPSSSGEPFSYAILLARVPGDLYRVTVFVFRGFDPGRTRENPLPASNTPCSEFQFLVSP